MSSVRTRKNIKLFGKNNIIVYPRNYRTGHALKGRPDAKEPNTMNPYYDSLNKQIALTQLFKDEFDSKEISDFIKFKDFYSNNGGRNKKITKKDVLLAVHIVSDLMKKVKTAFPIFQRSDKSQIIATQKKLEDLNSSMSKANTPAFLLVETYCYSKALSQKCIILLLSQSLINENRKELILKVKK